MELIKLDMTPKERLSAYAIGEEVDRIPALISLSLQSHHLMNWEKLSRLISIRTADSQ